MNSGLWETRAEYYRYLRRNILLTIVIVSFTPMILITGTILYRFDRSYREKVCAHLSATIGQHRQAIDTFLKERLADILMVTRMFGIGQLREESFLQDLLEALQQEYGAVFVDLGVINARGIQEAYAGPFKLGQALYSTASWFREAMTRRHYVSDVFLGLRGLPHFIVAVKDNWNGEPWIVRATIDFAAFNRLVEGIRMGETGFAFILNRRGQFQTKPLMEVDPSQEPYRGFLERASAAQRAMDLVERKDPQGNPTLYVAAFLKGGDWLLVYQQKASEAYEDLYRTERTALILVLLGAVGIGTMAFLLSRILVGRIRRVDQEKARMDDQIVEAGRLASIGELAAGIAHEINNPVAIMVEEAGWIEDLLDEEPCGDMPQMEEFRRALKQIRNQGARCKEITHKLLSFARKTQSTLQEVALNLVIEEVVALSAQRARFSNVEIRTELSPEVPFLRLSVSELQQVLLNLINNALDAMEKKGGRLVLRTRVERREQGPEVVLEVADTGPGIPKANLARIFDPFFTTKPVGKGTGLGLSICYGIVKKWGGEIEVESQMDAGTTFRIRVPLDRLEAF